MSNLPERFDSINTLAQKVARSAKAISLLVGGEISGGSGVPSGGSTGQILGLDGEQLAWINQNNGLDFVFDGENYEFINGNLQKVKTEDFVRQSFARNFLRGASFEVISYLSSAFQTRRWTFNNGGNVGNTAAINNSNNETGWGNRRKLTLTQGGTGSPFVSQYIDLRRGLTWAAGQTLTFSGWARRVSGPASISWLPVFRKVGGASAGDTTPVGGAQTLNDNWTRHTFTFNVPAGNPTTSYELFWVMGAGTQVTEYTDFQLEIGSLTDFARTGLFLETLAI
jgi:hypothetical protein